MAQPTVEKMLLTVSLMNCYNNYHFVIYFLLFQACYGLVRDILTGSIQQAVLSSPTPRYAQYLVLHLNAVICCVSVMLMLTLGFFSRSLRLSLICSILSLFKTVPRCCHLPHRVCDSMSNLARCMCIICPTFAVVPWSVPRQSVMS